ncbi:hypothetical protein RHMOL_Rhmol05G0255800 [Rhododendron molle]|uniref:Uncharacterized protein n=1 Tax=Rhododendron molle TaxID=49168 RepID=A0ACC0NSZ4_RHOML|nr:hypothetical protein RHMOL_Rhmol05G0255800 [Rhododendron molle]
MSKFSPAGTPFEANTARGLAADTALWFKRSSVWTLRDREIQTPSFSAALNKPSAFVLKPYPPYVLFDQRVAHIIVDGAWKAEVDKSGRSESHYTDKFLLRSLGERSFQIKLDFCRLSKIDRMDAYPAHCLAKWAMMSSTTPTAPRAGNTFLDRRDYRSSFFVCVAAVVYIITICLV